MCAVPRLSGGRARPLRPADGAGGRSCAGGAPAALKGRPGHVPGRQRLRGSAEPGDGGSSSGFGECRGWGVANLGGSRGSGAAGVRGEPGAAASSSGGIASGPVSPGYGAWCWLGCGASRSVGCAQQGGVPGTAAR